MSSGIPLGAALAAATLLLAQPLASHGGRAADPPRPPAPAPAGPVSQVAVEMRTGESLAAALTRAGLDGGEAGRAAAALAEDFDIVNPHPGLALALAVSGSPAGGRGRLIALSFKTADERQVTERRGPGGVFEISDRAGAAVAAVSRVGGRVDGSLYMSMVGAGIDPPLAAKVVDLFGRRLDLSRDVESGDRFTLVFERAQSPDGIALADKTLLFAEVIGRAGPSRLYRFAPGGAGPADYLDGEAGPSRTLLLRTPVTGARITSGFGMRLHPILGFTRMHQGVDFGASEGAPVLAAGDGVVEEARWDGGYGRWLKIRHDKGLETGYAHLEGWAPGVAPGARVRQGEVVAFVGASGLATGPHLHFEVFSRGQRIDPALAATTAALAARAEGGDPVRRARFLAAKARIDARVAAAG